MKRVGGEGDQPAMEIPSVVPFLDVDPAEASSELFLFEAGDPPGSRRLVGLEAYCADPECECTEVTFFLFDVAKALPDGKPPPPESRLSFLRGLLGRERNAGVFVWDYRARKLRPGDGGEGAEPCPVLREALERALTDVEAARFEGHKQRAKAWGHENYWQLVPWGELDPDTPIAWETVSPLDAVLTHVHKGVVYEIHDYYCFRPECDCRSCVLELQEPGARGERRPSLAMALLSTSGGRVRVAEVLRGKPFFARRIIEEFLEANGDADAMLRQRARFLHAVGDRNDLLRRAGRLAKGILNFQAVATESLPTEIEELKRLLAEHQAWLLRYEPNGVLARGLEALSVEEDVPAALPHGGAGPVTRNAPCPCGSGRKYKNCCGR